MTIDRGLEQFDAAINASTDRALLLALAKDLADLNLEWSRGGPIPPAQLDRDLRYALAPLTLTQNTPAVATSGWLLAEPTPAPADLTHAIATLGEAGVPGETLALLEDDLDRLALMQTWPGFTREARLRARLIEGAAVTLSRTPTWLTPEAKARLLEDFDAAVRAESPDTRDTALALIASTGRVLALLTEMGEGRQSDRLRSRASEAIAARTADDAEALAATDLAARTLNTSESLSNLPRDESMLRQIRPAWRVLVPRVRDATVSARDAAVNLLVDPAGVTNPGALASLGAQQRLMDDFTTLTRLSARFAPGDAPDDKANAAIADRLLALGQDMTENPALLDPSLALMRDLNAQLDLWQDIDALREPAARVIGDRQNDLAIRLESLQNQWLAAWGTPGGLGAGEDVARDLTLTRDAFRTMADASAFTDLAALESWPGYELDPQVRALLARELSAQIDALASEILRGPSTIALQRAAAALVTLRGNFGPALLTGRLARLAKPTGLAPAHPLAELALGPPVNGSWMAHHRDALADVSWYAAEWSRALVEDPSESNTPTQELRAHLRWRALRTLEAIERESFPE